MPKTYDEFDQPAPLMDGAHARAAAETPARRLSADRPIPQAGGYPNAAQARPWLLPLLIGAAIFLALFLVIQAGRIFGGAPGAPLATAAIVTPAPTVATLGEPAPAEAPAPALAPPAPAEVAPQPTGFIEPVAPPAPAQQAPAAPAPAYVPAAPTADPFANPSDLVPLPAEPAVRSCADVGRGVCRGERP